MKKRAICLVLCLALIMAVVTTVLCACDDPYGDKIVIQIGFCPEKSQTDDYNMYMGWKTAFEADHPEYYIDYDHPYTYSPETVEAKGSQGLLPTIFQTYFTEPDMLINSGYIRPITAQLEEKGWLEKMDKAMAKALTRDGEIYGLPRDGYGMGLMLNLRMMYDLGIIDKNADGTYKLYDEQGNPLYPTTFDEITAMCEIVADTPPAGDYGILILSANKTGGWQLSNLAWNFGAGNLQTQGADGKWTSHLDDPGMVKALEWVQMLSKNGYCYPDTNHNYNEWPEKLGTDRVLMAFVGNDAVGDVVTKTGGKFTKDDFALVPMPKETEDSSAYALFGGTPYVFADNATDEQVAGALEFLHYIGRSPDTDEIATNARLKGYEVAKAKGMPILPTIKPWTNDDYVASLQQLEAEHVNINTDYMKDFFDTIYDMRRDEEPNFCQDMYACVDRAIQAVLSNTNKKTAATLLADENTIFQTQFLDKKLNNKK